MRIEATWRMPEDETGSEAGPGEGLAGLVLSERRPIVCHRYGDLPRASRTDFAENAVLGLPLFWQDDLVGFFGIGARPPRRFDERDIEALSVFGRAAVHAINNARLLETAHKAAVLEERQRLARDLHDSVTQLLSSATLIAQSVASAYARDAEEGQRRIARVVEVNRTALAEMRALLKELDSTVPPASHPCAVQDLPVPGFLRVGSQGLARVLAEEVAAIGRDGLRTVVREHCFPRLPPATEVSLLRICQEALSNATKHASARAIEVELAGGEGCAWLRVRDDGAGFDTTARPRHLATRLAGSHSGGRGLATMRERASALGGEVRLRSAPGAGTLVEVVLPVESAARTCA